MTASRLWAVMPVKNIENAKQRLAPLLSPKERQILFLKMVEDVLAALTNARNLAGILMVTRDPKALRLAERYGSRTLIEDENAGHSAASTLGAKFLTEDGIMGMVQIPGDLPAITPDDIDALLDAHGAAPAVTIAPSRDELGSNAVACSPPDCLQLRFGDNSFFPHVEQARHLGIEPAIIKRDGIALDIDTADDLRTFLMNPTSGHTLDYLQTSGIAKRIHSHCQWRG